MNLNLKAVLRTYTLLRQLTDDETALLNTLRGMSDGDRELLVQSLQPEKVAKPTATRTVEHCVANVKGNPCNISRRGAVHKDVSFPGYHEFEASKLKSQRARGIAAALSRNLAGQRQQERCAGMIKLNGGEVVCDGSPDDAIHDPAAGYAGYHPFESSSPVPAAAEGS